MAVQILLFVPYLAGRKNIFAFAAGNLLEYMDETVIITDINGGIVFHNSSALVKELSIKTCQNTHDILNNIIQLSPGSTESNILPEKLESFSGQQLTGEISLGAGNTGCYKYNYSAINDKSGHRLGYLLTFRDISEYNRLIRKLDMKNRELKLKNTQLQKHSKIKHMLAVENERQNIIEQISRITGSSLKSISDMIEEIVQDNNPGDSRFKQTVNNAAELTRKTISRIRDSVSKLAAGQNIMKEQ
jgi:hypothetical protein